MSASQRHTCACSERLRVFFETDVLSSQAHPTTSEKVSRDSHSLSALSKLREETVATFAARLHEPHRVYHRCGHLRDLNEKLEAWMSESHGTTRQERKTRDCKERNRLGSHAESRREGDANPRGFDTVSVKLAIWFHDVVYDVGPSVPGGQNEALSAKVFREFCDAFEAAWRSDLVSTPLPAWWARREEIHTWILETARHTTTVIPREQCEEFDVFLDLDLSILGRSADEYERYAAGIRREYVHVPAEAYREGRQRVLRGFLELSLKEGLFRTSWGREMFELRARENLTREIQALAGGAPAL